MERKKARNWYWWLWLSPLLTIPTLVFIALATYFLLDFNELPAAMLAAFVSAAWHLFLLIPLNNKESSFVRWHAKQLLILAGLQIITLFSLILTAAGEGLIIFAWATGLAWFFGTLFGQLQAAKGDCSLMRWYGHENELLTLASEKEINLASGLDPDAMVEIIRFSRDPEERRKALKELDRLGMVEILGDSSSTILSPIKTPATVHEVPKKEQSKTNRWIGLVSLAVIIIGMIICNNTTKLQNAIILPTARFTAKPTNMPAAARPNASPTATTRSVQADENLFKKWPLVQNDTFYDGDDYGWNVGPVSSEFYTGSSEIVDGKLQWNRTAKMFFFAWDFAIPQQAVSDFYLSVEGLKVTGPGDSEYGVVFRSYGDDFYMFTVSEDYFSVSYFLNGRRNFLIYRKTSSAINKAGENKLAIVAQGTKFRFYINDQYVDVISDNRFSIGKTGLVISMEAAGDEAVFEFDNFVLRAPPADPEIQNKLDALDSISQGVSLSIDGDIEGALENFSEGQSLDPEVEIGAENWNTICWFGSLWGYAADVLDACEKAVALDPDAGHIRDSRGLARALLSDYDGAIEDFEFFLEQYKKEGWCDDDCLQREDWIIELEAGINPFGAQTLEDMKND